MSEEKFTQGEWKLHLFGNQTLVVSGAYRKTVCEISSQIRFVEKCANANLIIAAPEMYALLKMIADPATFMGAKTCEELRTAIEAVLKKARGEA